jgi:replicative DNA helicase
MSYANNQNNKQRRDLHAVSNEMVIPCSIEAEEKLLGICMSTDAIAIVCSVVKPEDFYREINRQAYTAMMGLYECNENTDAVSVSEILSRKGVVIEGILGGYTYLSKLADRVFKEMIPISSAEQFATMIADTALARRGMQAAADITAMFMQEPARVVQAKAEAMFAELGQAHRQEDFTPMEEVITTCFEQISERLQRKNEIIGIPTGFSDLDRMISGLRKGKLVLVAGRPGMGKTSWALTVGYNAAHRHQCKVGILSLEMSKEELGDRMIAIDARLDSRRVTAGQLEDDEWERVVASAGRLSQMSISIDDSFGATILDLKSKAKRLQATQGLDLLIVDYLQLMDSTLDDKENEVKALSEISRGLKGIARDLDIPVIALAQLSRAVENRQSKIPQLSDLRGSGSLEQDADIVFFLYREEEYNPETERKGMADVIVAKHRAGPKGIVTLRFDASQTRFYELMSDEELERYV